MFTSIDNAVTVAPNYTTINAPNNQYANLVPPKVVEQQIVDIPAYGDLKQQKLDSVIMLRMLFILNCD